MLVRIALACIFAAAFGAAVQAGERDCKSEDPAIAIPACTKQIEAVAAAGGPAASAAYFDRAMAQVTQFFTDQQKNTQDAQACMYEDGDKSLAACSQLIDNSAADPDLRSMMLFQRSKKLSQAGRGAEAMADFQRTLNLTLEKAPGAAEAAIGDFSKAIELDPNNASALTQRGDLHMALQNADAALADFEKAITLDPKQMAALFGRAYIRNETGNPVGAVADYKAILALTGSNDQEKWMQDQAKQRLPTIGAD
jgi:tetratricopeptide (TPR) repeat protein